MPIAGKDFKTGQTLVKSGFAPIIGDRCLGLNGWFSTNILGNRDGLVLDEPANFRTKEVSKLSTLETILVPENQPIFMVMAMTRVPSITTRCVSTIIHRATTTRKAGIISIFFGWMGYPMQIKINFLCRDSILAAPLCLDLVLPQRPCGTRRPLRHAAFPQLLPQESDARLYQGRDACKQPLSAAYHASQRNPRDGRL